MDKVKGIQTEPSEEKSVEMKKQRGKRLYESLFPLESPKQVIKEESYDELLGRPPSFEGRLANEDNKNSLEAYRMKV